MPRPTDWNAIGLDGDPTPGDPERIRTLATELNGLGTSAREISTAIDAVMNTAGDSVFVGEAANALRDKVDDRLRGHIEDVAQSFESASTALTGWADKLTELQQTADGALSAGRGLSEDDSQRETYATTARQAGTDHSEAASTAAGTIRGVANIQLPISQCEIFWEAFQWLAIILIIPALIFGGPIALLAIGVNLTLFLKTVVDFARGDANFLDLFLAGLGILAPTTKALPIFQIIKAGATAFGRGFANVARSAFQGLRNLFTNGFRFTSLMPGIQDFLRLSTTWVRQNGLWVMQGLHNLPQLTGMAFQRGGLTILQGLRAIPGVVRGLPSTLGRGFTAGANGLGRAIVTGWNGLATGARATWNFAVAQLGGSKWLRLILPVDAGEIGQYGLRGALRIGLFERGVMGSHIFGAPLGGAVGRGVSAVQVPLGPHGVDGLVDMPRVQLNNVRLGDWAGSNVGTRPFQTANGPVDLSSALRTPDLHLGDVGALGDRTGLGLHASRQLDALVDIPKAHLNAMHLDGFGTMPGRGDTGLGVSAGGSAPTLHSSGLYLPASAGAPTSHGVNLTAAGPVPGGTHATLTAVQAPPPGTAATADVLLSGGPGGTHTAPATTVLTGAHTPPPGTTTTGNLLTPGTPGPSPAHTVLSGTQAPPPGVTGARDLTTSSPGTQGARNLTVAPGTTAGATPPATGVALGTGTQVTPGAGVSAFDLLAGGARGVPDSPVPAGAGHTLADRTTSALTANQTRLHLDELLHVPGSPRPGGAPTHGVTGSAVPTPVDPARGTAGGAVPPPEHSRAALDLVENGGGVRSTDSPAFAGAPGRTDTGAVHSTPVPSTGDAVRGTSVPAGGVPDDAAHAFAGAPVRRNTPVTAAQYNSLTPAQIEQLWIRDGERVDALFGAADDPLRQTRREAWRDFAQTRHDLGRAEDLVRGGDAGSSSGPSVHEIRIRQNVENAQGRYDAAHRRLTDLGVDPARMDADFTALYTRSLSERPRVVAGMYQDTPASPHPEAATSDATPPPVAHTVDEATTSTAQPQRLDEVLADHSQAVRDLQRIEASQSQVGKSAQARNEARIELDGATKRVDETRVALDDALTRQVSAGELSQRELNMLVDQFAGAGDIERAAVLREHAVALDVRARSLPPGAASRPDQIIRTGTEIRDQALTVRNRAQDLERALATGTATPEQLKPLSGDLTRSVNDLEAGLQGFVRDAAPLGGAYALRNEFGPVASVGRYLAKVVDEAVEKAAPGAHVVVKGFLGTETSVARVRPLGDFVRRFRTDKAYAEVPTGQQWKSVLPGDEGRWKTVFGDFDKLPHREQISFVRTLSEENVKALRREFDTLLDGMSPTDRLAFRALRDRLENLPYRIKHATPAYHAIANSGIMSSQGDLARRGVKFLASGKSSAKNTSNLGNDDFVFFRMEVGDKAMESRYGPTTLVFDAKVLEEKGGWVSLHDQLHPLDRETMRHLTWGEDLARGAKYDSGFDEVGKRARWTYQYPDGSSRPVSFEQEVFHGEHVREALALSVVREVASIGGDFQTHVLKLLDNLDNTDALGSVVSKLYRPEAKFASGLPINPSGIATHADLPTPLQVVNKDGDGRYLADGTVDPAARAAGKKYDEAADRVRQADNAIASKQTKSVGYHLRKAELHAQQSVDLTRTFHASATGERQVLAQGLLDQRVKLLEDIQARLKPQPKPQPQPPAQVERAGSSVTAAGSSLDVKRLVALKDHPVDRALTDVLADATPQAKKMARVLVESGGFRPLANSTDGVQTTAAVGLGRSAFDKAFKALRAADLVVGMDDGLHLTDKGRTALLPRRTTSDLSAAPSSSGGAGPDIPTPFVGGSGLPHGPASSAEFHGASLATGDGTRIGGDLGPVRLDPEGTPPGRQAGHDPTSGGAESGTAQLRDLDLPKPSRGGDLTDNDVPRPTDTTRFGTDDTPQFGTDDTPRFGTDDSPRFGTDDTPRLIDETTADPLRIDPPSPALKDGDTFPSPSGLRDSETLPSPSGLRDSETLPSSSGLRDSEALQPSPAPKDGDTLQPSPAPKDSEALQTSHAPKDSEALQPSPTPKDSEALQPSPAPKDSEALQPSPAPKDSEALQPSPAPKDSDTLQPSPAPKTDGTLHPSSSQNATDTFRPAPAPNGANASHAGGTPRPPVGPRTGGAGPVAADLLDPAVFRSRTATPTGIRSRSQIDVLDRGLAAFHRIPETQLAERAQALDQLAAAADNFLRIRPDSARRAGVQQLLNQTRAEATAYRLLHEYDSIAVGQGARAHALDNLADRTRAALSAGGAHQGTHTRLQGLLTRAEREADAYRLFATSETPPRLAPAPAPAPGLAGGDLPWAREYAGAEAILGPEGRPFREAWSELTRARQELGRVENLGGGPATGSTSRPLGAIDAQRGTELATAQADFRTAYQNLRDLGIEPRDIDARLSALNHDAAVERGARVGAGFLPPLPDSVPTSVATLQLSDSGVAGPNGLTIERITAEDGSVSHRVVDHRSHLDDSRTVTPRPDGGFDVRHTATDTVTVYNEGGSRIADDIPLRGVDGQPNGLRLHTDVNGHGRPQESRVPGPDGGRYSVVRLPDDTTRITDLRSGVTTRFGAQGDHLDQGLQLTGRDGTPAATDRVLITEGAGHHVTDLAGNRLPHQVTGLGAGNGFRVTDDVTGSSVRHDGQGHLRESGLSLTDAHGTRGGLYLADNGAGAHTVTDALGTPRPGAVTVLPDGGGFRVVDDTTGATTRYAPDGHWQDAGRALAEPATGQRGARIAVPDGSGGHRLTDLSGNPLPERVVDAGNGRLRTIDDVSGRSVLHDADARPVSTATALADPVTGQRGTRFAEPDGSGGHRLTDPHGTPLPDAVTALPGNGGFRTAHTTGYRTFGTDGALTGDGLRLTGRHGGPGGHLDRPQGGAARWLDDAFTPDPSRPVTVNQTGHIEIGAPGGGHQLFDGTTGRFVREVTPLPAGGHRITAADGSFGRYDAHGDLVATGTPLPGGPAGRNLVTQPPTAAGNGPHGAAWLEDAAGRRLPDWNVTTRTDGTLRVEISLPGSARRGEFLELAADGTLVRQGFNVLDSGRRTDFQYVVDRATGTWQRTTRAGAPTAVGAFHHGAVDLTGAAEGRLRLLASTGAPVAVFERRVLPGATGDVLDSFRRTDTIAFGRSNPRTTWARWDDSGALRGSGSRHYDTAGTGWSDTDGLGRTVREYRDGLQKFDGRPGHTLAVRDEQGAWTWHRHDDAGHELASGPRTREGVGGGWTDRTADGRVAQRQWGGVEWPERAGQYQEHTLRRDGTLADTWERQSPHGKEVGKREVMRDGGILTTERWREQRPPAWVRTRWLPGAQQAQPPYAHVRGDNTYQLFTWAKEAPDATTSGVRYVGLDGSTLDLAADGSLVRSTGKLYDGTTLKVGDHARRPGYAPDDLAHQPWEESGGRLGYRVPQRDAPGGALWQDVYREGSELRVAREGRPGGVVREYADSPAGDRSWVDRDAHGNLVGQGHPNPDGVAHHVVEGAGPADSGRWTWRELDADGAEVATGRREFFRGSSDSRLPWDDSYRDYDAAGALVRERRMLDSGRYTDAWRDPDLDAGGRWLTTAYERDGTPVNPGAGEQIRRWWNPRTRTWQDQWLPGAGHFRDELRVTPHGPHLTLRETPVGGAGPLRVRSYDTTVTPGTPARSVWQEYDHGTVVRRRRAESGGFLETDAWRGQWNRYTADGDLVARRTDSGLVFERDTFGRWRLVGNEYDFRGPLTEIRGWGRRVREAQRMPWSGTTVPEGPFGLGGNPALREARYQPYWRSVAQKAALEFGQEFLLEFGANLAVNGIVAAAQNKPFTGQDALKSFANAAVGAGIKTGLSTAIHENRGAFFRDLGDYKAGYANIDGGKPWTRRPGNHDKTWANEWAGNETATRWRGGTYDFSFGVLTSVLSGWVNGSMNAAVWGVSNANGDTVKLSGWEALADGGINAAASLTTAVTTGLVKNVFVLSTGGRLFHRQGFADFWVQLPFKLFEKSIQSLYLTSAYRANISPPWYQAP
ncbi:hypothetical protein ACFV0T_22035 [Streptomyces sp. NPDC059582]|uniref:hypothetical protein n=1 Tax=Streptomyces sp. NPDC059582 TaxID=3346875 RepID=UPI003688242D